MSEEKYDESLHIALPQATDDTQVFIKAAMQGLDKIFKEGIAYAKAGITLHEIRSASQAIQGNLLDMIEPKREKEHARSKKLMTALDGVNARFGKGSLQYASEGLDDKAAWRMRQKHLSPKVTTNWETLPIAVCR